MSAVKALLLTDRHERIHRDQSNLIPLDPEALSSVFISFPSRVGSAFRHAEFKDGRIFRRIDSHGSASVRPFRQTVAGVHVR